MACSYDDFLGMGRSQLVDFLHVRGLVTSGRKVELVARAFTAVEMQLPIKLSTEEHQKLLTTEYQKRLVENNISDPKDHNIRQDDITKWPPSIWDTYSSIFFDCVSLIRTTSGNTRI